MNSIILDPKDNVGVTLDGTGEIAAGHKYALCDIGQGEPIVKYGEIIGRATKDIKKGEWVHTHNVRSHLDEAVDYTYHHAAEPLVKSSATFQGYKRKDGRVGIRNDIYIIPTVGCVNGVCKRLEREAQKFVQGSIDGIFALTHQFGCSQLGEDRENIKKLLCAIALNPNASFVLIVGLGCENNGLEGMKEYLSSFGRENIEYYDCQEVEDEHAYGMSVLKGFAQKAQKLVRESVPFSKLCIGLKCGGSDGFSGVTANPLVGKITDRVISLGGSAILTEIPEMFGAEQLIMNQCKTKEVFEKYKKLIEDFKAHYVAQGFPVYENPSPGNKEGGITTLEEKSLGCVRKAGKSEIVDVLEYGEPVKRAGVSVLNAPGNDLIAATALAASGCQIVLFTTGRGTPFGTFVPTLKIATNSRVSGYKRNWIDFDAYGMDEEGLFSLLIHAVEGTVKVKSEDQREIAFFKTGVTL